MVNQSEKQALLVHILKRGLDSNEMDRLLVFTRTKHGADKVVRRLADAHIPASAIHGNKSQPQREKALDQFRRGKIRVLVATDIAARGIDIQGVSHVINFELPNVAEQYVHRIGRTARAGAAGVAVAFCASDEREYLRDIQKLTKVTLGNVPLPEGFRAIVDSVEEHSRAQPQRRQKAKVVPAKQPRSHNRPRNAGGQGQQGREHGPGEQTRHEPRGDNRNRNRRRKPRNGGQRSASGGQRG